MHEAQRLVAPSAVRSQALQAAARRRAGRTAHRARGAGAARPHDRGEDPRAR
nr:hypothetical protein [Angustibacter aerolatus]